MKKYIELMDSETPASSERRTSRSKSKLTSLAMSKSCNRDMSTSERREVVSRLYNKDAIVSKWEQRR